MKIGIFTTHFAINYGAVLQAYALRKKIENLGYECEVVDFRPLNKVDGRKNVYNFKTIKSTLYSLILILNFRFKRNKNIKIVKFDTFLSKHIKLSSNTYDSFLSLRERMPFYNTLICGSDQIWNLNLFNESAYFLRFEDIYPKTNFIAYAPSIAEKMTKEQFVIIANNIKHFSSLSIREKETAKALSEFTNFDVKNVLDPVFLLSPDEWSSIEEPLIIEEPFILTYALASGKKFSRTLLHLKKKHGFKVVNINLNPFDKFFADYSLSALSPGNFVWLFRNAEIVCTSSFHGTVFSILFEKQFFSIPASKRSIRMENILKHLSLEERLIMDNDILENKMALKQIDYYMVTKKLLELKQYSITYLKQAIEDSNNFRINDSK